MESRYAAYDKQARLTLPRPAPAMELTGHPTAIAGTQSDPWKPVEKPSTGRLPGRSACRCAALPRLFSRYAFLRRAVTLWAALWAETVFTGCEPVPDSDFEFKIAAETGRNR